MKPYVCLVALLLLIRPAAGQRAYWVLPSDSVWIGDRFSAALVIERPRTMSLLPPPYGIADSLAGDIALLRRTFIGSVPKGDLLRDSLVFEAAAFMADSATAGGYQVRLLHQGDTLKITAEAATVPVRAMVRDTAAAPRPFKPPFSFPVPWWYFAVGLGVLLTLAGILSYWFKRPPKRESMPPQTESKSPPVPILTPYEEANACLDLLKPVGPTDSEGQRAFFVGVSALLKRFLESNTGLPAAEMTTNELAKALNVLVEGGHFPKQAVRYVISVLTTADLVKFAGQQPSQEYCRKILEDTHVTLLSIQHYYEGQKLDVHA